MSSFLDSYYMGSGCEPDVRDSVTNSFLAGSIHFLEGTELSVTKLSTNAQLCVHYLFLQKFNSMKNPDGEKARFMFLLKLLSLF